MISLRFRPTGLLFLLACALLPAGCDIVQAPYLDPEYIAQLPADEQCLLDAGSEDPFSGKSIAKKVLLEEMTGHKCGNCPAATEVAYDLAYNQFPDRVVLMGIHAGPLASFTPTASKFFSNYTTEAGNQLYGTLNTIGAVPFALFDRTHSSTSPNDWLAFAEDRLAEAPGAGIHLHTCFYPDSNDVGVVVRVRYLQEGAADDRLSVFLVEDHIVDWQKDYRLSGSPDIPDYTHHNILRAALNGAWGEPLSSSAIASGSDFTKTYRYRIPAAFNTANCRIIALVHNFSTREVRQVEIAPVQ
ncbi:MAG: Omp28-related outer membrane protein [Bacteroidia bacterium]|nr:Omp28-related outer membrane protein [Bacteroidia bacterium]